MDFSLSDGRIRLNNLTAEFPRPTAGVMRYPLFLFTKWRDVSADPDFDYVAVHRAKGAWTHFNGRIEYFKIYDDGVLVRDLIPVRFTNEQGQTEGAMYDKVTKRLFRNQGTGAFVIGPDK